MNITVQEVNKDNWHACTQLKISEESGRRFIAPIVYSLAESKYETHLKPLAIYKDETVIGFSMYCKDQDDGRFWIYVFMIDENSQGNGYGKAGLRQILHYIWEVEQCDEVIIGHKPENVRAGYLYETVGFKTTGETINGEIIRAFKYTTGVV